jgi:hypothetical protein
VVPFCKKNKAKNMQHTLRLGKRFIDTSIWSCQKMWTIGQIGIVISYQGFDPCTQLLQWMMLISPFWNFKNYHVFAQSVWMITLNLWIEGTCQALDTHTTTTIQHNTSQPLHHVFLLLYIFYWHVLNSIVSIIIVTSLNV